MRFRHAAYIIIDMLSKKCSSQCHGSPSKNRWFSFKKWRAAPASSLCISFRGCTLRQEASLYRSRDIRGKGRSKICSIEAAQGSQPRSNPFNCSKASRMKSKTFRCSRQSSATQICIKHSRISSTPWWAI